MSPYLNFEGNCEEAFNFYHSVFGGKFLANQKFGEVPSEYAMPEVDKDKIMHIALEIKPGAVLMGSDKPAEMGGVTIGDNVHISISVESREEADQVFDALSKGGKITMPLDMAFWGDYFGMCTDKYGINWMISYAEAQEK